MLRQFVRQIKPNRGFTIIELLIVIAIIAILAAAILAAINPVEQLNRSRDTGVRSVASELLSSLDRYYTMTEEWPWNAVVVPPETEEVDTTDLPYTEDAGDPAAYRAMIGELEDKGEVRPGFDSRFANIADRVVMHKPQGFNETAFICFRPRSNAFREEAAQSCMENGNTYNKDATADTLLTLCNNNDGDVHDDNYICIPE